MIKKETIENLVNFDLEKFRESIANLSKLEVVELFETILKLDQAPENEPMIDLLINQLKIVFGSNENNYRNTLSS